MPTLDLVKSAMSNPWVRYIVILLVGITIGAVFYPTKSIKETISKQYEQQIKTLNEQHQQETDRTAKTYDQTINDMKTKESQSSEQIQKLSTQVTQLKSHVKTTVYKIVHPDGSIEEHDTSEEDTDQSDSISTQIQAEYQQKLQEQQQQLQITHQQEIATLQKQFDQKEANYKEQISSMQESKTVITNPKHFGVEAGMLVNKDYYGHVTYDIFGPVFLGLQGQFGPDPAAGIGIGIRF